MKMVVMLVVMLELCEGEDCFMKKCNGTKETDPKETEPKETEPKESNRTALKQFKSIWKRHTMRLAQQVDLEQVEDSGDDIKTAVDNLMKSLLLRKYTLF